jgi:hypothetical protein
MSALPQSVVGQEANRVLLTELQKSRDRFLSVLAGVPEKLRHIRLADDTWSILECAEHTCLAEQGMFAALEKRRLTDAAPELEKDALIAKVSLDRTRKLSSPQSAKPAGRYASLAEAAKAFASARDRTIGVLGNLSEDLRKSTALHPMGVLDSYQFVRIMVLHPERHALQIEEIKRSAAYHAASNT